MGDDAVVKTKKEISGLFLDLTVVYQKLKQNGVKGRWEKLDMGQEFLFEGYCYLLEFLGIIGMTHIFGF